MKICCDIIIIIIIITFDLGCNDIRVVLECSNKMMRVPILIAV